MEMNRRREIALGPAFSTLHRSITALRHASTPPSPNSVMLKSPHFSKPAGGDQEAAIPIKFEFTTTTSSLYAPVEKPKKDGAKKPKKKYASFDEFIRETKKRIMSDDDEDEDLDKVVVEFGKIRQFSD